MFFLLQKFSLSFPPSSPVACEERGIVVFRSEIRDARLSSIHLCVDLNSRKSTPVRALFFPASGFPWRQLGPGRGYRPSRRGGFVRIVIHPLGAIFFGWIVLFASSNQVSCLYIFLFGLYNFPMIFIDFNVFFLTFSQIPSPR